MNLNESPGNCTFHAGKNLLYYNYLANHTGKNRLLFLMPVWLSGRKFRFQKFSLQILEKRPYQKHKYSRLQLVVNSPNKLESLGLGPSIGYIDVDGRFWDKMCWRQLSDVGCHQHLRKCHQHKLNFHQHPVSFPEYLQALKSWKNH